MIEDVNGVNTTVWNLPCTTSDDGDGFIRKIFQGTRMLLEFDMTKGKYDKADYTFSWTGIVFHLYSETEDDCSLCYKLSYLYNLS